MYNKDEQLCLNILEAVNKIIVITQEFTNKEDFKNQFIKYDAVMLNFIVIGEMAGKLSNEFVLKQSSIDWIKINGFRNIIAHDYFGIDNDIVWQIVQTKIPELKCFLDQL
jgi:uncharacterized protein with HEPN domain